MAVVEMEQTAPNGGIEGGAYGDDYEDGYGYEEAGATFMPPGFELLPSHIKNARVKARISDEDKFAEKIAQRREFELERRQRIYDAKRRTIGVDKDALDAQVEAKKQQKELEMAQKNSDAAYIKAVDTQLKLVEAKRRMERHEMEKWCKEFSGTQLSFEHTSTYDLNDPERLRKALPGRVGDDDPRCGPASMQQFNGEDLLHDERKRQQQAFMKNCIEQQKFEKTMLDQANDGEAQWISQQTAEMIQTCNYIDDIAAENAKSNRLRQQEDNIQKAMDTIAMKRAQRERDMELNRRELEHHSNDPFLNEVGVQYKDNGQVVRDTYKGSSREEREAALADQLRQCADNDAKRQGELLDDLNYANQQEKARKHCVAMDRQRQLEKRMALKRIAEENRALFAEKLQNKKVSDREILPAFTDEFFQQFGKGIR